MDWNSYVDSQCTLLGLRLTAQQREGVLRYLALVGGMAPRVMDFPLTPADESGNVFQPVAPEVSEGTAS
ncbi:MAG: DUF4089 domain-containing protein [Rubrivivax sp.]|nr:DUF4089 domain-containing protein [Rubrivivax sp.]